MAKTSGELEKEFLAHAKALTGYSVEDWMKKIRASGAAKPGEILAELKTKHGMGHLHAQFLAGMFMNDGKPVYVDESVLLEAHLTRYPEMRPLVHAVTRAVLALIPAARLIPKKTYLSFTDVREFVTVNLRPGELRLGLDLGKEPFSAGLRKAVLTGPMPRFTHMLVLGTGQAIDNLFESNVLKSHERSHTK